MAERQRLSTPAAPMDHEHRDRLPAGAAVVDRQTSGTVRRFEARDLKAPVVINEAAGGADIDATFIEYTDRQITELYLGVCRRSHCCPPKANRTLIGRV